MGTPILSPSVPHMNQTTHKKIHQKQFQPTRCSKKKGSKTCKQINQKKKKKK